MVSRAQDHAAAWHCGCHKTHFVVMGAAAVGATLQGSRSTAVRTRIEIHSRACFDGLCLVRALATIKRGTGVRSVTRMGKWGFFEYRLGEVGGVSTERQIRDEIVRHSISSDQIIEAMRSLGLCAGREAELVSELLAGEGCSLGVALAVFWLLQRNSTDLPDNGPSETRLEV